MFVWRHTLRHELHPEAAADLGEKAIEIKEPFETFVAPAHLVNISESDNNDRIVGMRLARRTEQDRVNAFATLELNELDAQSS